MDKYKIKIGGSEYVVDVAEFEDEQRIGLSGRSYISGGEGMLFAYDSPTTTTFTMENTEFDLTIVLMDNLMRVVGVYQAEAMDKEPFLVEDVNAVLEIPPTDKVKIDSFMQILEVVQEDGDMVVLDENGDVQMALKGNERILSRPHTQSLVSQVLYINAHKDDPNIDDAYEQLGKWIFSVFNKQDIQKPEYVKN